MLTDDDNAGYRHRGAERLVRCVFGLLLYAVGVTLIIRANLGAAPWDVFHTGVSELTGISVGSVILITGVLLLALWVPLRVRPGIGTILNAMLIGLFVKLSMPVVPDADRLVLQTILLLAGVVAIAVGSGFYIGAGLGPGPRDGLMTGLAGRRVAGRSVSVRSARTAVEIVVLVVGIFLGGAVGIGTAVFTFAIGPLVQLFLPPLTMPGLKHDVVATPGKPA